MVKRLKLKVVSLASHTGHTCLSNATRVPPLQPGEEGKGAAVGPGETLEFDVELLGIDGVYHHRGAG